MPTDYSHPDQHLLQQIRHDDGRGAGLLYSHCYPAIERYVIQHNGTVDNAKDVFQDTLLIVLTNVRKPDFQLTSSLRTYVFSISKHLLMRQLKHETRYAATPLEELSEANMPVFETVVSPSVIDTIGAILSTITARCLALLTALFFQNKPIDAIVRDDGYASRHSAQNQKYKCLEQARQRGRVLRRPPDEDGTQAGG